MTKYWNCHRIYRGTHLPDDPLRSIFDILLPVYRGSVRFSIPMALEPNSVVNFGL